MKISQLLYQIESKQTVLPEFQREYVWSKDQAKELLISLFQDYPIGSFLFWETDSPPEIKNQAVNNERAGITQVILDGQQRLTTLYLFVKNEIPPYYTEDDIDHDPRDLYFNLKTGEFRYYQENIMGENLLWQSVTDCFAGRVDPAEIAEEISDRDDTEDLREILGVVNENFGELDEITEDNLPIQKVPSNSSIDEAIDVFDRINSQGTPLTDAELVLAHITGEWPDARRKIKNYQHQLAEDKLFDFDLDFFTRALVVGLNDSALYDSMTYEMYKQKTAEDYRQTWNDIKKAIDYLLPVLEQTAYIDSSDELLTNNIYIPIIAHLMKFGQFKNKHVKHGFMYWLFLAHIWGRYSGQTDQRLDKDVNIAIQSQNPVQSLVDEIKDMRGRIEVEPSDIEGRGARNPLMRMLYTLTKWKGAEDWITGGSIRNTMGDYYSIQRHHIFPSSLLYELDRLDSQNHIDRKKVNEIANRAFITRESNYDISNKHPSEYLSEVEEDALNNHFIPTDPDMWKFENYEMFLEKRRRLITDGINEFLHELRAEWEGKEAGGEKNYQEIIESGENNYTEFKSLMRWSHLDDSQDDKESEYIIAKNLAAFMNAEGGTLFIGVEDDGEVTGLQKDYDTLGDKQDKDGFLLALDELVKNYIGKEFKTFLIPKIIEIDNNDVCVIEVTDSTRPVFVDKNGEEEFYVRFSASTRKLTTREANEYIKDNWS